MFLAPQLGAWPAGFYVIIQRRNMLQTMNPNDNPFMQRGRASRLYMSYGHPLASEKLTMPQLLSINNYYYRRGGAEVVFFEHNRLFENAGWGGRALLHA